MVANITSNSYGCQSCNGCERRSESSFPPLSRFFNNLLVVVVQFVCTSPAVHSECTEGVARVLGTYKQYQNARVTSTVLYSTVQSYGKQ
jgi:hypothetical protein